MGLGTGLSPTGTLPFSKLKFTTGSTSWAIDDEAPTNGTWIANQATCAAGQTAYSLYSFAAGGSVTWDCQTGLTIGGNAKVTGNLTADCFGVCTSTTQSEASTAHAAINGSFGSSLDFSYHSGATTGAAFSLEYLQNVPINGSLFAFDTHYPNNPDVIALGGGNTGNGTACLFAFGTTCTPGVFTVNGSMTVDTLSVPAQKAASGKRYACIDTNGNIVSSATACSGT